MKIPGGYILQPRKIDESRIMHEAPCTREVWFYILRKVNYADSANLKRGQGFFRYADIMDDLCWYAGYCKKTYSKTQIAKSLRRLREGSMVATTKTTRGVLITILNYEFYQDPKNYEGNSESNTKATTRQQCDPTIKKKNKKNKEEKKNTTTSPEPREASAQEVATTSMPPLIVIPTTGNADGYGVTTENVREWSEAYPAVDVMQSLRSIRQWNLSNPAKQKTMRGVRRHITSWLERDQNKGGNKPACQQGQQPAIQPRTYAQAQDAERRQLAQMLLTQEVGGNGNERNGCNRAIETQPYLPTTP